MISVLRKQYSLIQNSREVVLNFLENQAGADLNTPVPAYDNSTIRYLLVHNANCYFSWLIRFALQQPVTFANDEDIKAVSQLRELFISVDEAVAAFLANFEAKMELPIDGMLSGNRQATATPLQLFTHVTTHEFHHKGQIMSMCRLLGHTPPDTDIIRF